MGGPTRSARQAARVSPPRRYLLDHRASLSSFRSAVEHIPSRPPSRRRASPSRIRPTAGSCPESSPRRDPMTEPSYHAPQGTAGLGQSRAWEWEFLTSDSWLVSRTKRIFNVLARAGIITIEVGKNAFDQLVRRTLKSQSEVVRKADRLRTLGKWSAVGLAEILTVATPLAQILGATTIGVVLLIDPDNAAPDSDPVGATAPRSADSWPSRGCCAHRPP